MNERKLETMEKSELAREYFFKGYNCAQSVALAFTEELGMSEETVARTVSGFGGGFGRMREMCGAVSGMVFVLSVLRGYGEPVSGDPKTACYALIQKAVHRYKEANGSNVPNASNTCRGLGGPAEAAGTPVAAARPAQYYEKRPCPNLCACAAGITAELLHQTQEG